MHGIVHELDNHKRILKNKNTQNGQKKGLQNTNSWSPIKPAEEQEDYEGFMNDSEEASPAAPWVKVNGC